jgi:hypothetical protein
MSFVKIRTSEFFAVSCTLDLDARFIKKHEMGDETLAEEPTSEDPRPEFLVAEGTFFSDHKLIQRKTDKC